MSGSEPASAPSSPLPRPAATVVLLRSGPAGAEVLLTRRPSTMAFGPDLHVFPGGAVEPADVAAAGTDNPWTVARQAAIRELREEAGIELAASDLIPLSVWTTPPVMPRRFQTRFFVAELPATAAPVFDPREVVDHTWLTPSAGLDEMADGRMRLWIPTSSTLAQLEGIAGLDDVRARAPAGVGASPGTPDPPRLVDVGAAVIVIHAHAAGGIPGRHTVGHLVGGRRHVLVDHGDPSEEAADAVIAAVERRRGRLEAIVLTSPHPDRSGGADGLALRLGIPILAAPRASRRLPHAVTELGEGDRLSFGDVPLRVVVAREMALELAGDDVRLPDRGSA